MLMAGGGILCSNVSSVNNLTHRHLSLCMKLSVNFLCLLHTCSMFLLFITNFTGGNRLWDVRTGNVVRALETKSPVTSAEVSQDGRYITTADGFTVKFWDANQ